ncbi:MAG: hypothetical protein WBX95_15320, partial [Xanthobacteraceae bacterium]
ILLRNSPRSAPVIGLDIISIHAKLIFSFRPLMSWTSFSRSLGMGIYRNRRAPQIAIIKPATTVSLIWLLPHRWAGLFA